jgi:hypothetical protein
VKVIAKVLIFPRQKPALLLFCLLLTISLSSFGQFQPTPVTRSNNHITVGGKNYYQHEVIKGQTLYGITKAYEVSEEEIKKLNPELSTRSVYPGMVLRIPDSKSIPKTATTVKIPEEIAVKNDQPCKSKPFPHENDNFRLAILLPLNIEQNDSLNYTDSLKADHFRFYEFLEGVYLAIDSMQRQGLNMTVEIFDTERSTETINKIISAGRLNETDLIIGPVFPNEVEIVSAFSKSKHIPMVSPLSTFDVVKENPFAFQVRNKLPRRIELVTDYLGSKYNQNIILIGRYAERKSPEFIRFQANLASQVREHDPAKKATIKTAYFSESSRSFITQDSAGSNFERHLSASGPNYIILASENEVFITEVVNEVHKEAFARDIHIFGLNQWVFTDLDLSNLYDCNLEIYSDFEDEHPFIDYTDPGVLQFCSKYKENWNIEPSKYSFQGFDITYYFTKAMFQFGRNLTATVPCWQEYIHDRSMLTPMKFQSFGNSNGFNNQAFSVVRYQKDELIRKKVN